MPEDRVRCVIMELDCLGLERRQVSEVFGSVLLKDYVGSRSELFISPNHLKFNFFLTTTNLKILLFQTESSHIAVVHRRF
jgi:hypothetical protein